MAKAKKVPRTMTLPETLPEGLERVKVPFSLDGKDKPKTNVECLRIAGPVGYASWQKLHNENAKEEGDPTAAEVAIFAVNSLLAQVAKGNLVIARRDKLENFDSAASFANVGRGAKILDPAEAYGEDSTKFMRVNKRPMPADVQAALFAVHFGDPTDEQSKLYADTFAALDS